MGVWLTDSLTPTLQCQKAANKAMQVMGMIRRSFKYLTKESFLLLYKSLIWPHLEHFIPAWSPNLAKDIDPLEKIWHHATKLVSDISSRPTLIVWVYILVFIHCFVRDKKET